MGGKIQRQCQLLVTCLSGDSNVMNAGIYTPDDAGVQLRDMF